MGVSCKGLGVSIKGLGISCKGIGADCKGMGVGNSKGRIGASNVLGKEGVEDFPLPFPREMVFLELSLNLPFRINWMFGPDVFNFFTGGSIVLLVVMVFDVGVQYFHFC